MKNIFLLLAGFLLTYSVAAQNITVPWVRGIRGTGNEVVQSVAVDASGNVYVAGSFEGTVNFNPAGTASNLTSAGGKDAFFAKYNSSGILQVVSQLGSTGNDEIYAIIFDGSVNVYVAGYFEGTVDFDTGSGTSTLTSSGSTDIFYGKYGSVTGSLFWANKHGSTSEDYATSIDLDASGNLYVTGFFGATVDFDPSAAVLNKTSVGGYDVFFGKYTSLGSLTWINTLGSGTDDKGWSVDVDASSNVYIGGSYTGTTDFDPSASTASLTNLGGEDGFFAKFNSSGAMVWANRIGATDNDRVRSVVADASGNIYVGGEYSGTLDFDNSAGVASRTSQGLEDIFVTKYSGTTGTGQFLWVNTIGATSYDGCNLISLSGAGDIHLTGYFNGTADFDPSAGVYNLTSTGYDAYSASFSSAGNFNFAGSAGGSGLDQGTSITTDASGNFYVVGAFETTVDFDPGTGISNLTSLGLSDGFVAKYKYSSLAGEPSAQATGLNFTNITTTGFDFSFTAASGGAEGYIGVRRSGASPTTAPTDGVTYTAGDILGDGIVFFVGAGTSYFWTAATPSTTYHLDIYAYNGSGTLINYRTTSPHEGSVTTLSDTDTTDPVIASNSTPTKIAQNTALNVTAQFNDPESGIVEAKIFYSATEKADEYADFIQGTMVKGTGNNYTFTIPAAESQVLGVTYYFYIKNGDDLDVYSDDYTAAIDISGDGLTIPFNSAGTAQSNYRIISIPMNVTSSTVNSVLGDDFGESEKKTWRVFQYQNNSTQELSGSSSMQYKRGYWLIASKNAQLDTGPGSMPQVSLFNPETITLTTGWNLIGNPYPFDVSWADILEWNDNPVQVGKLRIYKGTFQDGTELEKFSGGFVMATGAVTLEIPVYRNPSINGRKRDGNNNGTQPLDASDWEVDLKLKSGDITFDLGGIGMNVAADVDTDKFDDFTLPRFQQYLEINHSKTFMEHAYSRDIIPTASHHSWDFTIDSNTDADNVELSWDNSYFGANDKHLMLWDEAMQRPVDMRTQNVYVFNKKHSSHFKVFYGSEEFIGEQVKVNSPVLHEAFPNPVTDRVTFSFSVPESPSGTTTVLEVFDLVGRKISTVFNARLQAGYHEVEWNAEMDNGARPASGVYVTSLKVGDKTDQYRVVIK